MKKNRMMRLASILLVCVLLTTSVISGTFAKYVSETTATGSATVASWDVKLEGKKFTDTITFDFTENWINTDETTGVNSVEPDKLLAPGTEGSFDLTVTNDSEVAAEFKIAFDFTELAGLPLEFTYKVDNADYNQTDFLPIAIGETETVTVTWEWPFHTDDAQDVEDTELGIAHDTFDISATLVMQQVD